MTFDSYHGYVYAKSYYLRKILAPTDFSENGFNVLKYAYQTFKYEICKIFIVHPILWRRMAKEVSEMNAFEKLKF